MNVNDIKRKEKIGLLIEALKVLNNPGDEKERKHIREMLKTELELL